MPRVLALSIGSFCSLFFLTVILPLLSTSPPEFCLSHLVSFSECCLVLFSPLSHGHFATSPVTLPIQNLENHIMVMNEREMGNCYLRVFKVGKGLD